ncbi:MAG TPA: GntR family transcriptional regulator [Sphingomonas sp.]
MVQPKLWSGMMASDKNGEWSHIGRTRQSLNNVVADALREAILSGQFKPGDRLPEPQLADMFGVSRNPIREALQVLSNEGLVEISPRKGARVPLMTHEELAETIELRAELEGISARNATRHCDTDTRNELETLLRAGDAALAALDKDGLEAANNRFHQELGKAGRNRYLAEFMRSLRDRTFWLFSTRAKVRVEDSWREHARILQAVIIGEEQRAAELASEHVRQVGKTLLAELTLESEADRHGKLVAA